MSESQRAAHGRGVAARGERDRAGRAPVDAGRTVAGPDRAVGPARVGEPVRGRMESPDQASPWSAADPPGAVPDPIPGTNVGYRVEWLTRARDSGPDRV